MLVTSGKEKSVTIFLPIKNEGIFIVTHGFRYNYTVIFMPDWKINDSFPFVFTTTLSSVLSISG